MVTLLPWFVTTDFGTCSYQCFLSNCTPVSLHMLKCIYTLTLSCLFTHCSFDSIGHADIIWSIVSSSCWHSLHLLSVSVCSVFVAYYYYYYHHHHPGVTTQCERIFTALASSFFEVSWSHTKTRHSR
jgi:hypothetical protein